MRIAITAQGETIDSQLDERFGRCRCVLFTDDAGATIRAVANPALDDPGGAGIGMAQYLAREGVDAVITGRVGPKAEKALATAHITVHAASQSTVRSALQAVISDQAPKP